MESFVPNIIEKPIHPIEKEADFEGNHTLLMLERLANPVIHNQLVDMLVKADQESSKTSRQVVFDEKGNFVYDDKGEILTRPVLPKTREEIEDELKLIIENVANETPISFEDKMPTPLKIYLNWCSPSGLLSAKQKGIVEAHEKGHLIRRYSNLRGLFGSVFDWSKAVFSETDYLYIEKDKPDYSYEEYKTFLAEKYMTDPSEIVERMSQLKNYFGMQDHEIFTSEHLAYARQNYVKDTGLDNHMTLFFSIITPETESEFIRLINSSGI